MTFKALYRRETGAYFNAPTAYITAVVFLLIAGFLFAQPLFLAGQASIRSFVDLAPLLLTFFMPALTMRHFAEEYKSGTIEILLTFPVGDWEVLAAKFLATLTLLAATLALTLAYPLAVGLLGRLDWGAVAGAYVGLLLTGALLAAAGMFASTLTRNQVVAFILGFVIAFALFLAGKVGVTLPLALTPLTDYLGLDSHLDNLARGVFDTRDLVYYLSGTGFFLFLCQVRLWLTRSD